MCQKFIMLHIHYDNKSSKKVQGFVTLFSVLVMMTVLTLILVSSLIIDIDSTRTISSTNDSQQAMSYSESCAEYAINQLQLDLNYTGNQTINFSNGFCTIEAIAGAGNNTNREINASGNVNNHIRRVEILLDQVKPNIIINYWKEVPDF